MRNRVEHCSWTSWEEESHVICITWSSWSDDVTRLMYRRGTQAIFKFVLAILWGQSAFFEKDKRLNRHVRFLTVFVSVRSVLMSCLHHSNVWLDCLCHLKSCPCIKGPSVVWIVIFKAIAVADVRKLIASVPSQFPCPRSWYCPDSVELRTLATVAQFWHKLSTAGGSDILPSICHHWQDYKELKDCPRWLSRQSIKGALLEWTW